MHAREELCTLTNWPQAVVGRGNYGFVEFDDPGAAERALLMLNGRQIHGRV